MSNIDGYTILKEFEARDYLIAHRIVPEHTAAENLLGAILLGGFEEDVKEQRRLLNASAAAGRMIDITFGAEPELEVLLETQAKLDVPRVLEMA